MPFHRRAPSVIQSFKHIVDSEGSLSAAAVSTNGICFTVTTKNATLNPIEVTTGEKVNAIFISLFLIGATGAGNTGSLNWYIAKKHFGQNTVSDFPDPGQTGVSPLRNQIIHEEKGLAGSLDGTPMAFKGVIVIPRGMRRMREDDEFFIKIKSTDATTDSQFCLKAIYKSFS